MHRLLVGLVAVGALALPTVSLSQPTLFGPTNREVLVSPWAIYTGCADLDAPECEEYVWVTYGESMAPSANAYCQQNGYANSASGWIPQFLEYEMFYYAGFPYFNFKYRMWTLCNPNPGPPPCDPNQGPCDA